MLKKVEDIKSSSQLRASAIRGLKANICSKFSGMEDVIPVIFPNDSPVLEYKMKAPHNHISFIVVNNIILFIQTPDFIFPHLKLLHKYPDMLKKMQVDKGAIRHVIGGANVMCRGLTTPGGNISAAEIYEVVCITGEEKQHAMAIGIMKKSSDQIKSENSGIGIESLHFLGDGIWRMTIQ